MWRDARGLGRSWLFVVREVIEETGIADLSSGQLCITCYVKAKDLLGELALSGDLKVEITP